MKPIIGISVDYLVPEKENSGGYSEFPYYALRRHYSNIILETGGLPVFLPFESYKNDIDQLFEILDGILIPGGDLDVPPSMYNEEIVYDTKPYVDRCEFELMLLNKALENDKPVLGICHGMQLLNVVLGGSLYQNIEEQIPNSANHKQKISRENTIHEIAVKEGTILHEIIGKSIFKINSNHRQSVKDLGRDLIISAICPLDEVVEAIESTKHYFVLGVEWHPEIEASPEEDRAIFTEFVKRAASYSALKNKK